MNGNNNNKDNNNNNIINNTRKENDCYYKIRINCAMKGLCNLENIICQRIIFPKENIRNKK